RARRFSSRKNSSSRSSPARKWKPRSGNWPARLRKPVPEPKLRPRARPGPNSQLRPRPKPRRRPRIQTSLPSLQLQAPNRLRTWTTPEISTQFAADSIDPVATRIARSSLAVNREIQYRYAPARSVRDLSPQAARGAQTFVTSTVCQRQAELGAQPLESDRSEERRVGKDFRA